MLTQSKEVQNAWRASQRTLDIKVTIDGKTYGATDVNSLKYDSGAYSGDTFAIGSTYSNTVQIEFSHLIEGLKLGMEVRPSIGIKTSSGYVYEPLGVFIISSEIKMDRNNNLTTVSASDRFCGLEGTYVSKLTYPAKVLDVIAEICAQSGVKANTDDLARLPHQADLSAPITGQSYRKALGWIAQLYVGYALFDRQGLFTIRTISEPNYELDPSQYEQAGLTKNEAAYKINGIQCQVTITTKTRDGESTEETKNYQAGDATGSQIKLENNIMTPQRLNDIWEQLKDITFYPFSLNWFGNPAVEAGDWLRLEDKQGNSFVVPNSSYTLDFKGGLSATSKADQTTSSDQMVPWQGSVAQVIKELRARRSPDGTVVFPPSVTEPPTNAKFNDVWFKKNGNATELWIFEKQDDGSGKWIRKDLSDDEIKKKVANAQQGLNQVKADIINNKQKADAEIENLNKSIEDNKKVADESLQKLNDSVTNLQGQYDNSVVPNLNKVMADASDALQKYITAQSSIADLTKQAQDQGKNIADITKTVDGLNINYANLLGDVNTTKIDVKGLQTTLGTANGDINQLKIDAQHMQGLLAGKVDNSTYTNFVNLTNQALAAKLTASDLNGYAKTVDVQATANGLRVDLNSVTDRMNNLNIGGRNLLRDSDKEYVMGFGVPNTKWENGYASTPLPTTGNGNEILPQFDGIWYLLTPGQQYTQTIWFKTDANTKDLNAAHISWFSIQSGAGKHNYQGAKIQKLGENSYKLFSTYQWPEGKTSNSVRLFDIDNLKSAIDLQSGTYLKFGKLKLEVGAESTDWQPAPEDTEKIISELSARITTTSQQFSSYYTKSETDNRTNSAKSDAVNAIKSDSNWQGLSNILTNSGFLQTADGFLQKVQQTTIPMLGGGTNYATQTDRLSVSGQNGATNHVGLIPKSFIDQNAGKYLTISCDVEWTGYKRDNDTKERIGAEVPIKYDNSTVWFGTWISPNGPNGKQRISTTYKLPNTETIGNWNEDGNFVVWGYIQIACNSAKISNLKVEIGSTATPWTPNPNDLATQSAFSELSQSLEGLRSTVGSNYGNLQSQISQSSSTVRTDLTNKINGVQNQVTTTADGLNAKIGAIQIGGRNYLRNSDKSITGWEQDLGTIPNEVLNELAGKTITVSCDVEWHDFQHGDGVQNRLGFEMAVRGSDGHSYYWGAWKYPNTSSGKERISTTYTLPQGVTFTVVNNGHNGYVSINGSGKVSHVKIEVGNRMTDWSPAPEDAEQAFAEVNATINGLKSTVSGNYGTLTNQITQTTQTTRNEITNKISGLQTQLTQQADDFNVSLNSLRSETAWQKVTSAIDANNYKTTGNYWIQAAPNSNTPDSSAWAYLQVVAYSDVKRIKQTWQRDNNENDIYTRLLIGDNWTSWQRTVTGGNIMAQINMSAGTTLIQNNKIYMDAASTVFSGNAFIPSAAITSLTADKITAGTINGAKVNVINLNANNITAGTLKGSNGEFYLDSGALHVWQNNHDAWIDQNGIHDYDNQRSVWIQKGEINFEHQLGGSMKHTGVILTNSENSNLNGAITIKGDEGFLLSTKNFTTNYWSEQGFSWGTNTAHYVSGSGILGFNNNITVSAGSTDDHSIAALIAGAIPSKNLGNVFGARAQPGVYIYGRNDSNKDHSFVDIKAPASIHLTTLDSYITIGDTTGSERNSDVSINSGNYLTVSADNSISITACSKTKADLMPRISLSEASTSISGDSITLNAKNYVTLLGSSVSVTGDFGVLGKKNAIVPTSRGMAAINAYETAEYYFGDIGETQTNSNGVVTVMIDPYFLETVNTLVPYQVFLTSYGDGNVWVSSRSANNFTVKSSNPNIHFAWEIKAKRKGYENDRMKIVKGVFNNEQY